jgi:hypothetical protein
MRGATGRRSSLIQPDLTLDVVLYLGLVLLAAVLLMWHPAVLGRFPPIMPKPHGAERTAAPRVGEAGPSPTRVVPRASHPDWPKRGRV